MEHITAILLLFLTDIRSGDIIDMKAFKEATVAACLKDRDEALKAITSPSPQARVTAVCVAPGEKRA